MFLKLLLVKVGGNLWITTWGSQEGYSLLLRPVFPLAFTATASFLITAARPKPISYIILENSIIEL